MAVQQFTTYVPAFLNQVTPASQGLAVAVSSTSPTLQAESTTQLSIPSGVTQGSRFYLTKEQCAALSSTQFPCFDGWYRVVFVDAGATAANIQYGTIGAITTLAKGNSTVTDAAHVLNLGIIPVVFLGQVTPGTYTIVQDLNEGEEQLLVGDGQTVSVGSVLVSTATGQVAVAGSISDTVYSTIVGIAEAAVTTPGSLTLTAAAAASGGSTVYTGTITGGGSNAFANFIAVITGFTNAGNNGTYLITASTATTLTATNLGGVAETHAGAAALEALVRARLGAPFAY